MVKLKYELKINHFRISGFNSDPLSYVKNAKSDTFVVCIYIT